MFSWTFFSWSQLILIVFAKIIVGQFLIFRVFFILSAQMYFILFGQRFFIKFQIRRFLISVSNETPIGLAERFDGCLFIIRFHSYPTTIIVVRILFDLKGIFELTGGSCMLVFNVWLWFGLAEDRFFSKRVLILLEVFHWGFHLVEVSGKF